ncbi:MAG TPA: hypothetical protein VM537_21965, partial [Anaerolineae bacterium]|nr:hypothetical protein [Anaerolineae bacterium]
QLYFEGYAGAGADQWGDEWGMVTERQTDRGLYGVGDLHQWVQAVRTQLKDILGQGAWQRKTYNSLAQTGPATASPPAPSPICATSHKWVNIKGTEVARYTEMGRFAQIEKHCDDFNYHSTLWGSAVTTGPYYTNIVTGSGAIEADGGLARLKTTGTGGDDALLKGESIWQFREAGPTNLRMVGFYAKVQIYTTAGTFKMQIGLEGTSEQIYWEVDTSVDAFWHLKANDGLGGTLDWNSNVTASSATDTHLEFAIDPDYGSNVGIIIATCNVGAVSTSNWPGSTLPGAGATFLVPMHQYAFASSITTGWKHLKIYYWEAWQEALNAGLDT